MKCLHGELCAQSTTQNGSFWFCNQSSSCNFFCSKDESYTYEKAAAVWKSAKQPHPRCEKHGKLAKMHVVKNLIGTLRFTTRQLDDASSKQSKFLEKTMAMNNLWTQEYSQVRTHAHYNVKLSIIRSIERRQ